MPFWTYMLHCGDRSFYVGHTDDLERRIGEHERGVFGGHTSEKLPLKLVWSDAFPTREEARAAELRIKGWSRPKKLALIRGDWPRIQALARNSEEKRRASTGSAKPVSGEGRPFTPTTDLPEPVEGPSFLPTSDHAGPKGRSPIFLHPHDHLSAEPFALEAKLRRTRDRLRVDYRLSGDLSALLIPRPAPAERRDELWRSTCFELFLRGEGDEAYLEYNFSPSTAWAAYAFDAYRAGMKPLATEPPSITVSHDRFALELAATFPLAPHLPAAHLNLTAVLESRDGARAYWALAHPPDGPPDFHHPACFVLELPPPVPA